MRHKPLATCLCIALAIACDDDAEVVLRGEDAAVLDSSGPNQIERICDGSESLRFIYQRLVDFSRIEAGAHVAFQNGAQFLYVRGDCTYWVWTSGTLDPNQETRQGVIDAALEADFAAAMRYDDWSALDGTYGVDGAPHDAMPDILSNGIHQIVCYAKCIAGGPVTVRDLHERIDQWVTTLYDRAEPMTGPVRVGAVDISMNFPEWRYGYFEWTLEFPLTDVSLPYPMGGPPENAGGFLVEDPEAAATLREARSRQLSEDFHPAFVGGFISTVDDDGPLHALWVRDALPIESVDGYVRY